MRIGLIGNGFVGEAFYKGMIDFFEIDVWDTDINKRNVDSLAELVNRCSVIFVSVPTPMAKSGTCDVSIVKQVVTEVNKLAVNQKILVIRSTVPPGTCESIDRHPFGVSVVFNPEFLTEANHIVDFKNQDRIVLGGRPEITSMVKEVYETAFPNVVIACTDWKTAEMVKYVANTFLATKVTFANEIKSICDKADINYENVVRIASLDRRIGSSHWNVPGPDGRLGFGGTCFPKDMNALIAHAKKLGVPVPLLKSVWKKNLQIRPERDWEQLKGRAVSS